MVWKKSKDMKDTESLSSIYTYNFCKAKSQSNGRVGEGHEGSKN